MLAALLPMFDDEMSVRSYILYSQKDNYLLEPLLSSTAGLDGSGHIDGLEIIQNMGIDTLSQDNEIFVPVSNISIFTDIAEQCKAPRKQLVLLLDHYIKPEEMYISRLKVLKQQGYKLAIQRLHVSDFEPYRNILLLMDYIFLDYKKINISKAKIYFSKIYPNIKLIAHNISSLEDYKNLKAQQGYHLYEGEFYRLPIVQSDTQVSPLKINYIELLNLVNDPSFELTRAADIVSRDTALVISLLKMVNRLAINSEITSIRHAAAMLGQKELRKWITTAVAKQLCSDKPNEITRISLLRAKFAENLAETFELASLNQELFIMGLFSVLDIILGKRMDEALSIVRVPKNVKSALLDHNGPLEPVLSFIRVYENADWQEISRLIVLNSYDEAAVYQAYLDALVWYRDLFLD